MQRNLERAVDTLLRPTLPEPAEIVRVLLIHGGEEPTLDLGEGVQIVHVQRAVASGKRLDVKSVPPFDLLIAESDEHSIATTLRFLFVRRPAVFVILGQNQPGPAKDEAENMGYEVRGGKLTDGAEVMAGTLIGVAPVWETLILLGYASPLEFDTGQVIREAVQIARLSAG